MVDRCAIEGATPCMAVDLDGTYVKGNTLKIYLACGMSYLRRTHRYKALGRLLFAVVRRRLRLSDHKEMKSVILDVLSPYPEFLPEFAGKVTGRINSEVAAIIEDGRRKGWRILLATAAPSLYVSAIWPGDYVATEYSNGVDMVECRGEEKLRRVKEWMAGNGCTLHTVVTDHSDDLPLLAFNSTGTNILVNPSSKTLSHLQSSEVNYTMI